MIEFKRMKVPKGNVPGDKLLDYLQEHLRNKANGKVLRYAIVDASGKDFVVDVSVRTNFIKPAEKPAAKKRGRKK